MEFTLLYRVPRTELQAVRPDLDFLDRFPCLDVAGVGSGYWSLLAMRLQLDAPAAGEPIALDEAGGVAVYEWSRAFVDGFPRVDPDLIEAVVHGLGAETASLGLEAEV